MASLVYDNYRTTQMNGGINLSTDTIKVALFTASYTPAASDTFLSGIIANETSGTGYTTGGQNIATQVVTQNSTTHLTFFNGVDNQWTASSISARYAVIYKYTGSNSTSPLIVCIDLGSTKTTVNDIFYIAWNSTTGIFYLQ
jgi:hypothetical protein